MQPKNEKPRSNQRRRREMKRNNHNPESKWRARSGCLVGSRDWAARFPAAECFSPLPGKQPPLGIKHGWGRGHKNWDFTSSSSCKQSGTVPRLSMRAKLVISYANGGAGSFRGKVCLKSRVHVFANGRYQLSQVLWSTSITLSIFIANDFSRSDCLLQLLETSPQKSFFCS